MNINNVILLSYNEYTPIGAGAKAPSDISNILKNNYKFPEKNISFVIPNNKLLLAIKKIFYLLYRFLYLLTLSSKKTYIMQSNYFCYPIFFPGLTSKILKKKNIILYIHDIVGLRNQNEEILLKELKIYNSCKYVIVHNSSMEKFLVSKGVSRNKLYVLECFDYLCNNEMKQSKNKNSKTKVICYCGNLKKSPFLWKIKPSKMKFKINAYGIGIDKDINNAIIYKGKFSADDLEIIKGDLGLVWDGKYDESDEEVQYKAYTKYNNPHKLSCYLATGLPVIVWEKSAIAPFVKKNNIGYTINNIYDINKLDFKDYNIKKKNAISIGKKVRKGFFTCNVLEKIYEDNRKEA